jgi:DHA1 family bicyclomycin/chloramphenicol resistance-like MFS transporter
LDRVFLGHALTGGIAIAGMFSYIAGSPFVFIKLYGVPAEHLAGCSAPMLRVSSWWRRSTRGCWPGAARRFPAGAHGVGLPAGGVALLAVSALHTEHLWPLLIPLFICIASLGCILPNASACAMNGQGARAGASAMLGCLQFSVAAGAASLVGVLHDGSADADGHGHQPVRCAGGEHCDVHPAPAECPGLAQAQV